MKKTITLLMLAMICNTSFSQIINSFSHPSGYLLNTTCSRLVQNGYLVAGTITAGSGPIHYITRYQDNGTAMWTKTEDSQTLTGIADMAEDAQHRLYFLAPSAVTNDNYTLMKTDATGNLLATLNINIPLHTPAAAPSLYINPSSEVFVVTSTLQGTTIVKIDTAAQMIWSKVIIMGHLIDAPIFTACPTPDGGIVLAGKMQGDLYFQRLDSTSEILWTKRIFESGVSETQPGCMIMLEDGNFLMAGSRTETTGDQHEGLFVLKFDTSGLVLDHQFYYDNMGEHVFMPYTIAENSNGDIRISGKGNEVSFVDLDATLGFVRYTEWTGAGEVESLPHCFDSSPTWFVATASKYDTTQYILLNTLDGDDFCSENEINSIVQQGLAFDNGLYDFSPYKWSPGMETWPVTGALQNDPGFTQANVCGTDGGTFFGTGSMTDVIFSASPNPVPQQHDLTININTNLFTIITFTNTEGKVIKKQHLSAMQQRVSMNDMPTGIYFMNVYVEGQPVKSSRLIVY